MAAQFPFIGLNLSERKEILLDLSHPLFVKATF